MRTEEEEKVGSVAAMAGLMDNNGEARRFGVWDLGCRERSRCDDGVGCAHIIVEKR